MYWVSIDSQVLALLKAIDEKIYFKNILVFRHQNENQKKEFQPGKQS